MFLAIDIGNSRTKVAVYENTTLIQTLVFSQAVFREEIEKILSSLRKTPQIVMASVGKLTEDDLHWLQQKTTVHLLNALSPLPYHNDYGTPTTLGADRAVLVAGATLKFPGQHRLIIDAGTCITYDFINRSNHYLGGAISPGFSLRYKSLHDYTAKLPLLTISEAHSVIGSSTNNSIQSGVINGIIYEIEGFIQYYTQAYDTLTVILTGGDAIFLAKRLKNSIFAQPNFLLESLILHHQYICK